VLLIARADDVDEVKSRLAGDCWVGDGHLLTKWIAPWELRIGSLGETRSKEREHILIELLVR
jgi:hypothetical protein